MENQIIVEEGKQEEVKLNFSNLFNFLSSLDYLRFLELEGAFDDIKSKELYYSYERIALAGFVLKHVVSGMTLSYLLLVIFGYILFGISPIILSLFIAFLYTFLGFILVERYTIGRGYLSIVFRDFLLNTLVFTFFVWILSDTLIFYIFPKLWNSFESWFFSEGYGKINSLIYGVLSDLMNTLKPYAGNFIKFTKPYFELYTLIAPVKAFSLLAVYAYFVYLSRQRKDTLRWKIKRFKKLA